ncbi:MAG TPA: hypothetical protein PLY93_12975, partial [Turneriella sp.]|nr:hypothetical protein [Turneriella sp.]
MGDTTKEGRVIPLFSSPTHSNKKSASKQPNGSQLFRQVMGYVRKRAQKRHIGWTLIPALITLRIVSTDNMKAIRAAFEKGPSNENPVPPDLLSDFL